MENNTISVQDIKHNASSSVPMADCNEILPSTDYNDLLANRRFQNIDKMIESTVQICRMRGSTEAQTGSLVTVCEELQRLLRLSYYENIQLAKSFDRLDRTTESRVKQINSKLEYLEMEQKITKRNLKTVRKGLRKVQSRPYNLPTSYPTSTSSDTESTHLASLHTPVVSTDYESLRSLTRSGNRLDFEFMLRMNQLMSDFIKDPNSNELYLPPMGDIECAAVSKLAQVYKLRYRMSQSKSQVSTTYLIKARQTTLPASGEVDAILNSFSDLSTAVIETKSADNSIS